MGKRLVVKIGSAVITNNGNGLDRNFIAGIARQTYELMIVGHEIVIVSSGAIASDPKTHRSRNVRATVGEPRKYKAFEEELEKFGLETAQLLVEDRHFIKQDRKEKSSQLEKNLSEFFSEGIIAIINYNDGVSDKETEMLAKCADNDNTARMVCLLPNLDFDYLIMLTAGVPGVMDENGELIDLIEKENYISIVKKLTGGNNLGFGKNGIKTKAKAGYAVARMNRKAIIAPGYENDCLLRAFNRLEGRNGEKFGTLFI